MFSASTFLSLRLGRDAPFLIHRLGAGLHLWHGAVGTELQPGALPDSRYDPDLSEGQQKDRRDRGSARGGRGEKARF